QNGRVHMICWAAPLKATSVVRSERGVGSRGALHPMPTLTWQPSPVGRPIIFRGARASASAPPRCVSRSGPVHFGPTARSHWPFVRLRRWLGRHALPIVAARNRESPLLSFAPLLFVGL